MIGSAARPGSDNVFPVEARDVQHGHGNHKNFHGRAQVRLQHHQPDQHQHRSDRRNNRVLPVVDAKAVRPAAHLQKPGQIKNHGQLGEFGGLQAGRADANPAMRGVRFIQEENAGQHQQHADQDRENHLRPAQLAVIHVHHGHHRAQPEAQPQKLAQQKVRAVSVQVPRRHGRSAEHHDRADQAQRQRRAKHPSVGLKWPWHLLCNDLSRGGSGRVFFFQIADELLEHAPAVLVIFKLIEAGAGRRQQHGVSRPRRAARRFPRRAPAFRRAPRESRRPDRASILSAAPPISSAMRAWLRSAARRMRKSLPLSLPPRITSTFPGKRVQRLQRGVDVGGLRVIEIFHAGNRGHVLDAMLHSRERSHALGDRRPARLPRAARRPAAARTFSSCGCRAGRSSLRVQQHGFRAVAAKNNFIAAQVAAAGHALRAAEPENRAARAAHIAARRHRPH